jgi:hypothetical protein
MLGEAPFIKAGLMQVQAAPVAAALVLILAPWGVSGAEATPESRREAPSIFSLRDDDGQWSLVAPDGRRFFSRGVCVLDEGTPRAKYSPARPAYAAWRHYQSPGAWADAALRRLKSWRFTTVGGWSDFATLNKSDEQSLYLTPVLHLGSTVGFPWYDMWDERHLARMERLATERIDPLREDPRVIGYYSDNEMGWWNAALWKMTLEQPATSGQRRRLVAMLREHYGDDWNRLVADFIPEQAASWEELEGGGGLAHRPGSGGIRTMRRFLRLVADRYYQLMRDTIAEHDPDALFLGDRYQSFYYPEVVVASTPFVDVASTNLNASWNDGTFVRCHLDTLHAMTGRPVLVSEFYMAAVENRSGNKNATSGFPTVQTQAERAAAALTTLEAVAAIPYVIGAEWFQFYDEPPLGRADGEDYNFGLVDIDDQPYEELTAAFASFDADAHRAAPQAPRPTAVAGVPQAPNDPFANFRFMEALKHWDRERGFVPSTSKAPLGDMYVCWNAGSLFIGLYAFDPVEAEYYGGGSAPDADRAVWKIKLGGAEVATVRLGGGRPPVASDPALRVECLSGFEQDVRLIAAIQIPADRMGRKQLSPGDSIDLESSLVTHGGVHEHQWQAMMPLAD